MSDYVQQEGILCSFVGNESWGVSSPIEQNIKRKIELVGTPLKDWDINIYRGVITGYNEAFIISTEKRDEILTNCQSEEERAKTAELIRPILRGRDIFKYGYNWADLWLINVHNGIKDKLERIQIEDYPSVKQHLDFYINKIKSRADKGDTPYNLRNCAYMDEFSKPKIIYPNMTKFMPFVYDVSGMVTNQKCFIITGKHLGYLTAFFNSSLFKFCFASRFPELQGKTRELSKIFMDDIPILMVNKHEEQVIDGLINDIQIEYSEDKAKRIDKYIFDLYHLSLEEQAYIGFIDYEEK